MKVDKNFSYQRKYERKHRFLIFKRIVEEKSLAKAKLYFHCKNDKLLEKKRKIFVS